MSKKPAPPPPPERSYNVAVTASVAKTSSGNSASVQADGDRPLALTQPSDQQRTHPSPPERRTSTPHDRPHGPPPDRPMGPPPDRPKPPPQPPTPGTPGHQRSASTGTMFITTTSVAAQGPPPKAGSSGSHELLPGSGMLLGEGQASNYPSGSLTLGRHSTMRPRPVPPPPPPPINQSTENTHL